MPPSQPHTRPTEATPASLAPLAGARQSAGKAARTPTAGYQGSLAWILAFGLAILACTGPDRSDGSEPDPDPGTAATDASASTAPLVRLLADGQVLFGVFSGDRTAEQGAAMGRNRELDFVFYSLESGPFDIRTTKIYMSGIAEGSAPDPPHPLVLRVPAIRDGVEAAEANVAAALEAGVASIVFPHVESAEEAAVAVSAMGDRLWPGNPDGDLVNILIIEDKVGVERADEIVGTEGVSIVFPGPGDLRGAYEGDMEAVEGAIQTVLAACQRHGVPCGITANVNDIEERIGQGFTCVYRERSGGRDGGEGGGGAVGIRLRPRRCGRLPAAGSHPANGIPRASPIGRSRDRSPPASASGLPRPCWSLFRPANRPTNAPPAAGDWPRSPIHPQYPPSRSTPHPDPPHGHDAP